MRTLLMTLLPLFAAGCAQDAGSALHVTARSSSTRVGPRVSAIVQSFARERGFQRLPDPSIGPTFQTYHVEPPNQAATTSLYVFPEPGAARIEISEVGVWRPSPKHVEIRRALKTRLEAAGFAVSRIEPHIFVTH